MHEIRETVAQTPKNSEAKYKTTGRLRTTRVRLRLERGGKEAVSADGGGGSRTHRVCGLGEKRAYRKQLVECGNEEFFS